METREANQILLKDFQGNTLSWLLVMPQEVSTQLYFGTVVMKNGIPKNGERQLKPAFAVLMGFHKAYSKALLKGAAKKLA